jgi:ABC-type uncharacterized transport system permease subunit
MLEYRAELFLWALSGALPFILMGVWMQAAETGQFGLKSIDFARYFLVAFIVRQINVVWVIWEFEREVVQGSYLIDCCSLSIPYGITLHLTFPKGLRGCRLYAD